MNPNDNNQNLNNNVNGNNPAMNQTPVTNQTPVQTNANVPNVSTLSSEDLIIQGGVNAPAPSVPVTPNVPVTPTPMPQTNEPVTPTPMPAPADPNAKVEPINMTSNQPQAADVTVINNTKTKTSHIGVFIIAVVLILFVINVDKIVSLYDQYMKPSSLTTNNNSSDNLSDGYIPIGESSSSKKEKEITFNHFVKGEGNTLKFNYNSSVNYINPSTLNIYIEIYNSNKQLIYVGSFKPETSIESNSVSQYSMPLDSDIYNKASFVIVKTVTNDTNTSMNCSYSDEKFSYSNKYNFLNGGLNTYEITKKYIGTIEDNTLENEYINMDKNLNPTYEDNTLKYTVNVEDNSDSSLYSKGVSSNYIKTIEEAKEWKCE